ncbi:hypothetical protein EYF80_020636 [Liparis tanakae]|uniref:Uncharacterized protein n=1 Tax=Liparis tanakae TaxID=230148 RepID=A0A4Z2HTM7_9TELE|nr:hypothetical protein EYF80_020636 [Liparis tanakae]
MNLKFRGRDWRHESRLAFSRCSSLSAVIGPRVPVRISPPIVPTPEGKQHTGGQRGQTGVWTQTLPTDRACQSPDLACLER